MSHDQPDNAARLARLGVEAELKPKQFRGSNVAAKLRSLLDDPAVARRAQSLAARVDAKAALAATCDRLESLVHVNGCISGTHAA
jgi:UDP:flavonoid glycosyltransferase YjiC (YdhE family)